MKIFKYTMMFIASAIMSFLLYMIPDRSGVLMSSTTAFVTATGAFLAVDLMSMLSGTATLKQGDFKKMNIGKYLFSLAVFILLILEIFYIEATTEVTLDYSLGVFSSGAEMIIGMMLAGLEGNKIQMTKGVLQSNLTDSAKEEVVSTAKKIVEEMLSRTEDKADERGR